MLVINHNHQSGQNSVIDTLVTQVDGRAVGILGSHRFEGAQQLIPDEQRWPDRAEGQRRPEISEW